MKHTKVLGTGCANCKTTLKLIEEAARWCTPVACRIARRLMTG